MRKLVRIVATKAARMYAVIRYSDNLNCLNIGGMRFQ